MAGRTCRPSARELAAQPRLQRDVPRGDIVNIDMCGVYNRYHSNLARSSFIGEPSKELRDAMDKPRQVADAVRAELKPGTTFREILELTRHAAQEVGIWEDQWWIGGYDLGIAFPPDWVGLHYFSAEIDPGDQALEPGMVMNSEYNFYLPFGAGIRELIDTMIVTEDGVEFPHKVPLELQVVDVG
jgi:Xaa-Pro aminopeptidase